MFYLVLTTLALNAIHTTIFPVPFATLQACQSQGQAIQQQGTGEVAYIYHCITEG